MESAPSFRVLRLGWAKCWLQLRLRLRLRPYGRLRASGHHRGSQDRRRQDPGRPRADASLPPASPLAPLSEPPPTASARQPSSPKKPRWTRGRFVEGLEDCERQEKPREGQAKHASTKAQTVALPPPPWQFQGPVSQRTPYAVAADRVRSARRDTWLWTCKRVGVRLNVRRIVCGAFR